MTKVASATLLALKSCAGGVQAAEYTLRCALFVPSTSGVSEALEAWGKAFKHASNGRIGVDVCPAQALSSECGG